MNDTNNKVKVFWLIVAFVFICAGVLSFYASDLKRLAFEKKKEESIKLGEKITTSPGRARYILEGQVDFVLKNISNTERVLIENLDREISAFVLSGANSVEATRLSFQDGTNGFEIKYNMDKRMFDAYYDLLNISKTSPYLFEKASRANMASIIVTESSKYRVRVVLENTDENSTKVEVYFLEV